MAACLPHSTHAVYAMAGTAKRDCDGSEDAALLLVPGLPLRKLV